MSVRMMILQKISSWQQISWVQEQFGQFDQTMEEMSETSLLQKDDCLKITRTQKKFGDFGEFERVKGK